MKKPGHNINLPHEGKIAKIYRQIYRQVRSETHSREVIEDLNALQRSVR